MSNKLDKIVANAHQSRNQREQGYREKSLKLYPWICGRCCREFDRQNLHELTVHHRDHNHDNNPEDGSNWELLCLFCHDNEHQRQLEAEQSQAEEQLNRDAATHNPFADLQAMLNKKEK